jgi:hypothetical protein
MDFDALRLFKGTKARWKLDMIEWMKSNFTAFRDFMRSLLLRLLVSATIDPWEDLKRELDTWREEDSFRRALSSSPTSMLLIDLVGKRTYDLNYWINGTSSSEV